MCKYEGTSFRDISLLSLLSVVGKAYGRVLIKSIREGTKGIICEKQCGLRREWSCLDQVFPVKEVYEKFWAKGKQVF